MGWVMGSKQKAGPSGGRYTRQKWRSAPPSCTKPGMRAVSCRPRSGQAMRAVPPQPV
ncbi:hypothetical protein AVXHC19_30400 [Acidovorax sacchari]